MILNLNANSDSLVAAWSCAELRTRTLYAAGKSSVMVTDAITDVCVVGTGIGRAGPCATACHL